MYYLENTFLVSASDLAEAHPQGMNWLIAAYHTNSFARRWCVIWVLINSNLKTLPSFIWVTLMAFSAYGCLIKMPLYVLSTWSPTSVSAEWIYYYNMISKQIIFKSSKIITMKVKKLKLYVNLHLNIMYPI